MMRQQSKDTDGPALCLQFTGTNLAVMVAAFLAFQEFDTRMKQLVFGDQYWNRKVTA